MPVHEWLLQRREPPPEWLRQWGAGDTFSAISFFGSRTVYYPGCGFDGHPVKLFGSAHAAHCFVLVDYMVTREAMTESLLGRRQEPHRGPFRGYRVAQLQDLEPAAISPWGWTPNPAAARFLHHARQPGIQPYGLFVILERQEDLDDCHGPERLALLILGADGHAAFDVLYGQRGSPRAPYAVVLQDHGFGGNYSDFGAGGLLEGLAKASGRLPELLLVGHATRPWRGFQLARGAAPSAGGIYGQLRHLFVWDED